MIDEINMNTLLNSKPFKYLLRTEMEMIISYSKIMKFSDKEVLLKQGNYSETMYIILSGKAVITAETLGEDIINISTLNHGSLIGEGNIIERHPSPCSVIASGELRCLAITKTYFDMLSTFFPETKYKITKAIAEEVCSRINIIYDQIKLIMNTNSMDRLSFLGEVIKNLNTPKIIDYTELDLKVDKMHHFPIFHMFNKEEYELLINNSTLIKASDDSILIRENEKKSYIFIILRGAVQLSLIEQGKAAKLAVLGPLQLFSNFLLIFDQSTIINYFTCEEAILLKIDPEQLKFIEKNYLALWYKLFDLICKSYVNLEKLINKLNIRLYSEIYNR